MNKNYFFTIFDSRRYLSSFCFADLSCTRHNQSKLCFCSRFGKVHSVTMHRISFADTAASRQSKQACSALDFCSVSFADLAGVRQLKQASLLSLMQGWRPHSKLKSTDFVYVAWPRDSKWICSPLVFATPAHNQKSLENQFLEVTITCADLSKSKGIMLNGL